MWLIVNAFTLGTNVLIGSMAGVLVISMLRSEMSHIDEKLWNMLSIKAKRFLIAGSALFVMLTLIFVGWTTGLIANPSVVDGLSFASVVASTLLFMWLTRHLEEKTTGETLSVPLQSAFEAAKKGHPEAQVDVAIFYLRISQMSEESLIPEFFGLTLEGAGENARHYMINAAKAGEPYAQFNLALMYAHGRAIEQDTRAARYWYALASRQDMAGAQHNYAIMCSRGEGGRKSKRIAYRFFRKGAERGILHSIHDLAVFLDEKSNPDYYNPDVAKKLFLAAARRGEPFSMNSIGVKYSIEKGTEDTVPMEGVVCFMIAKRLGNPVASKNCEQVRETVPTWRWIYASFLAWKWRAGQPLPIIDK